MQGQTFYRGSNDDRGDGADRFYSASSEVADEYSAPIKIGDKQGRVETVNGKSLPSNLFSAYDKEELAKTLKIKGKPYSRDFDAKAKAILQKQGYSGIRYDVGTDITGGGEQELHIFGNQKTKGAVNR